MIATDGTHVLVPSPLVVYIKLKKKYIKQIEKEKIRKLENERRNYQSYRPDQTVNSRSSYLCLHSNWLKERKKKENPEFEMFVSVLYDQSTNKVEGGK